MACCFGKNSENSISCSPQLCSSTLEGSTSPQMTLSTLVNWATPPILGLSAALTNLAMGQVDGLTLMDLC